MRGVVRKILEDKAFGFIKTSNGSKEYFFHKEDCMGDETFLNLVMDYNKGIESPVNFTEDETPKGLRARNVMRVE